MRAIFAGTFDPFTTGHADIVRRSSACFSDVVVAVADDCAKVAAPVSVRAEIAQIAVDNLNLDNVRVMPFCGLLTDFADSLGGDVVFVRGARNGKDFDYEQELIGVYKSLSNVDSVLFVTSPSLVHVSSTVVRQLVNLGAPLDGYVVDNTEEYIRTVYGKTNG
ncbi:MAG: pantetheine-phosphate adenylyltransferase [Clostridiales bacterium]|nr:pantetheine-phosphate adenylyltransferase [Clostridiales bacterium]